MPELAEILLVEDNEADARLVEEALRLCNRPYRLSITRDGEEALQFLRKQDPFQDAVSPDLILLDLNLPKKDGREVLVEIKHDEQLQHIPVVVLTTSRLPQDIKSAYKLHANCYVTKPNHVNDFFNLVCAVEDFWFRIAQLPS
jgi:chemotaxis family two-component system response regulator Rcp1